LRNNNLGVTAKEELGKVLLPRTDMTNHWHKLVVELWRSQAMLLFEFLLTSMDDKLKVRHTELSDAALCRSAADHA
jgi:hypothetical protein